MPGHEIATIAAYLIAVVAIDLWTKRREGPGDFLIANPHYYNKFAQVARSRVVSTTLASVFSWTRSSGSQTSGELD